MSQQSNISWIDRQSGFPQEAAGADVNEAEVLSQGERLIALALQPAGTNPRFDDLLQAVGECVIASGLDGVTIDNVAEHSGLSRATVYRRFGTRDGMLNAFLARRSLNTIELGRKIAGGPGDLAARLETVLIHMISGVYRAPWMRREHARSPTQAVQSLFQVTAARVFDLVVMPMLQQAQAEGEWQCPAPLDELADWLIAETFLLMRMSATEEIDVQRLVRTYIMPVLNLRARTGDVGALAMKVEALSEDLAQLARQLHARPDPENSGM